jgi:succinate-semialdehyde dehydrogenase/glutarate-semialdehyde dehydrogenase
MKAGNGMTEGVTVGPLIDQTAMSKMERQVADARGKGARIITGGKRLTGQELDGGHFYAPTLIAEVTSNMLIYREETFGPLAPVTVFDTDDEALAMANDTAYGLASYVYTRDIRRAFRAMESLQFGMVGVNDINPTSAAAPFGGIKESGLGVEGAREGLSEYLNTKLVAFSL